jgi:hypothetical protein
VTDRTIDELLAEAENPDYVRVATAKVLLRQDLVTRHADLEAELTTAITYDATTNEANRAPALARELAALEAEMDAAQVEFRFANVGKKAWADLLKDHPPTKEQIALDKRIDHNPATFPIAAIAMSCRNPKMDEDEVRRFEAVLTDAQFTALWRACLDANLGGTGIPKSVAAGRILRLNGQYANSASVVAEPFAEATS